MIRLRYEELSKTNFQQALHKMANVQLRDPKAFKIKHMVKDIQRCLDEMQAAFKKDILAVFSMDGDGSEPALHGSKSQMLKLPFACVEGKEDEAKAALESFGKRECSIKANRLSGEFLLSISEWSAAELAALDPVLTDIVSAE